MGAELRRDPEAFNQGTDVARETMCRARRNVERLVERLPRFGFVFESEPLVPPPADVSDQFDALEAEIGALPLALRIWFDAAGMLCAIRREPPAVDELRREAEGRGMAWSALGPAYASYDREIFVDALNDWGWNGAGPPPEWCTGEPWTGDAGP